MLDIDESESSFKTSYRDKKFEVLRGDLINENIIDSGLFICLEGGLGFRSTTISSCSWRCMLKFNYEKVIY